MKTTSLKTAMVSALLAGAALAVSGAQAAPAEPGVGNMQLHKLSQKIINGNHDYTEQTKGVRTLHDYIVQDVEMFDFLFKNHPVFKYAARGDLLGVYKISTRGSEYLGEGNAVKYSAHQPGNRPMASQYRLPQRGLMDYPNKWVGEKKCGECHAIQFEQWSRSRHAKTIRFPGEHEEVNNDLKQKMYGSQASILPDGVYPEAIYGTVGTPRTKYGYIDPWLVRGSYHIRGGRLVKDANGKYSDGTGKIVAGGCQFSRGWAEWLTPERAKLIQKAIPDFPTTLEGMGNSASHQWGMTSYGSAYEKNFLFQPASSYCEICHSFKFDFKTKAEFFNALGNPKELQKHTISRGISCEECHGEGGHLVGAPGVNLQSNCERCHQRLNFVDDETKSGFGKNKLEMAFNVKTKSSCPSCGTEGAQLFMSKHGDKGMTCVTCHDPHEVTSNDWKSYYTKPAIKKTCQNCHAVQTEVVSHTQSHKSVDCVACHMPFTMTCENFTAIQFPDHAGFDAVRRSHFWKIDVHPTNKMMNPNAGEPRKSTSKGWRAARNAEGHGYVDLMWACARTAPAELNVVEGKGCHSQFLSELEKGLQYEDQKEIYGEVVKMQTPVKTGYEAGVKALARVTKLIEITKLTADQKVEVAQLLDNAEAILKQVKADGSWGVHASKWLKQRVETANAYIAKAQKILDNAGVTTAAK